MKWDNFRKIPFVPNDVYIRTHVILLYSEQHNNSVMGLQAYDCGIEIVAQPEANAILILIILQYYPLLL